MPAGPFGGHLTLQHYLEWAEQQGCTVELGVTDELGRPARYARIHSPDRTRWAIEYGTELDEFLVPTTVGRLDARLGLDSPFAKLP